jgi:hypothetical protein
LALKYEEFYDRPKFHSGGSIWRDVDGGIFSAYQDDAKERRVPMLLFFREVGVTL